MAAGTMRETVLPPTVRTTLVYGPWRDSSLPAQGQPDLLHRMKRTEREPRRMGWGSAKRRARSRTGAGVSEWGIGPPFEWYTRKKETPQRRNARVATSVTCTPSRTSC
jgi:hypothetical protein